ncbi:MAG: hypothetical protein OXT71_02585 [Acidobacteriota bacterium]|nr:hypothetical protein [Acidobacteriota bacterium]
MNIDLVSVLVAVVAVGVGLAGLTLTAFIGLRNEMRGLRQEMQGLRGHMVRIDSHIGELRERMAHVEGLLTGLRDAFVQRISTS